MSTKSAIFLTDYASYNNGSQFEFGHWVNLDKFSDEVELGDYISEHFKKCDLESPLDDFGSIREETMITDFEGFPDELYCESGSTFEQIYSFINLDGIDKVKVAFLIDDFGYSVENAIEKMDDLHILEYDGTYEEKYEIFEMYYPEAYENNNPYITVDEDSFIDENFTEFEFEGQTYLIDNNQL